MENDHIKHILEQLESGQLTASDAYDQLKLAPFEDLGYAKVDHHREVRQGAPEVIYGASKTKEQMEGIINSLLSHCKENILITRLSTESAAYLSERFDLFYDELSKIGIVNRTEHYSADGTIVVATGGTSDIPGCRGGCADCRGTRQSCHPSLRCRRCRAPPSALKYGTFIKGKCDHCSRRDGRRACERHRRPDRLSCHRRPDERWLRRKFWWYLSTFIDA